MIAALRRLDGAWLDLAARAGFRVGRSSASYVSYDGRGLINIAPDDELDDDDWLGQIDPDELCHHLVMGESSRHHEDWGLDNMGTAHEYLEHAALRLQAALADRHSLRDVVVPTTDFRGWYEALDASPLTSAGPDPSVAAALTGVDNARRWAHFGDLDDLLAATRAAVAP